MKKIPLLLLLLSLSLPAFAQKDQATGVDALIAAEMKQRNIPGLSLAVIKDGKLIKQSAYGFANVELSVLATPNTVYQIASATKSFTAVALMSLVQEGKLKLDDDIHSRLSGLPEKWVGVTVKHLLTHTSGLPDVALRPGRSELIASTQEEALQKLPSLPLQGKPGERWSYNQTNYVLLKMIIEKLSGSSLPEFMQRRFFQPLGMTSTSYADSKEVVTGRATNYEPGQNGQFQSRQLSFPQYVYGAAGINTSVVDLARWTEALVGGKLLPPAARALLWEAVKLEDGSTFRLQGQIGYGCGFMVADQPGQRSVGHSGGGTAAFRYYLDQKLTIMVLMNGVTNPDTVLERIAAVYLSAQ